MCQVVDASGVDISSKIKLTPTQRKIMALLSDGNEHSNREVMATWDEYATLHTLRAHIYLLRKVIEPHGISVMTTWGGYRMVYLKLN